MPQLSVEVSTEQVVQLANTLGLNVESVRDGVLFYGGDGSSVDGFVQRCIGTVLELDAIQRTGGQLLFRDGRGDVREVYVDLHRNGGTLRPPRSAQSLFDEGF